MEAIKETMTKSFCSNLAPAKLCHVSTWAISKTFVQITIKCRDCNFKYVVTVPVTLYRSWLEGTAKLNILSQEMQDLIATGICSSCTDARWETSFKPSERQELAHINQELEARLDTQLQEQGY